MKKCFIISVMMMLLSWSAMATPDIASSASTADCKYAPLETYSGTSNLEADWTANTIDLHWYNGDTELTVPSASQSCTYDGTLTPPATIPTKTGYTFKGWKVKEVPVGYTRLEYIRSNGGPYIDTGYVYTDNRTAHVSVDTEFTNLSATGWKMHGVSGSAYGGPNVGVTNQNKLGGAASGDFTTDVDANVGTRYLFDMDVPNRMFTVIDKTTGVVVATKNNFTNTYRDVERPSYKLFGYASSGGSVIKNASKIYSVRLYDNTILVRNMIPAKRNSDNVVGMWDTVSKTFFINAGTGTFTAGPPVQ